MTSLKRLTIWTLLAGLVLAFFLSPALGYIQGDMNDDGDVTLTDAVLIMKFMSKMRLSKPPQKEAGVGSDPRIGLDDLVYVLQVVSGLRSKNSSPTASFSLLSADTGDAPLLVEFDASGSSDTEGSVVSYLWDFGDGKSASSTSPEMSHEYSIPGTYQCTLTIVDDGGARGTFKKWIAVTGQTDPPPDPATVAPPLDTTVPTSIKTATEFLYTGVNPIQEGVIPDKIERKRAAVLRGKVTERDGEALSGVRVTVLDHPEFGQTLTREDGMFDLAVNGGGLLTVRYEKAGFLMVQRRLEVPWNDIFWLPDVAMVLMAEESAVLSLSGTEPIQVAQGPQVVDERGERQSTLLMSQGTGVWMVLPGGATQPFDTETLTVRATEYTVGEDGPPAMPDELPPGVNYTYCVELSVDEAAGAASVAFDRPLYHYVENFVGFPVGDAVPNYYYDREKARWLTDTPGRVIRIVDTTGGLATVDIDGDGFADDEAALAELGFTPEELTRLAALYAPGQTLWRVPLTHFSPRDYNWPTPIPPVHPDDGVGDPELPDPLDDPCARPGSSVVECQNQTLGESISVAGTPFTLNYRSDRVPGRRDTMAFELLVIPDPMPDRLTGVTVEVSVAGQRHTEEMSLTPGLFYKFEWDGLDAYGRRVEGQMPARIQVGYTYRLPFRCGAPNPLLCPPAETTHLAERAALLGDRDARSVGLGGWTLAPHHVYDPRGPRLYQGDGRTRTARANGGPVNLVRVAGGGEDFGLEPVDGIPAIEDPLRDPTGIAFSPDGSLYIADQPRQVIRKVDGAGIITTAAGYNESSSRAEDGRLATEVWLNNPFSVVVAPDGSFYFSEYHRVLKVDPDGIISIIAGQEDCGYSGDGGPATEAKLCLPNGLAVAPDGSVYIADVENNRIRKVDPFGIISTVAGNGLPGYMEDDVPATATRLWHPKDVTLGPDGSLYIADAWNHRVRKVSPEGIITTVAGNGRIHYEVGWQGDGGLATVAAVEEPSGVVVGRDGTLFISSVDIYAPLFKNPDYSDYFGVIRKVSPAGIITTIPLELNYGFGSSDGPIPVAIGPDGALYSAFYSLVGFLVQRLETALPGDTWETTRLASDEREEVYQFEGDRHVATLSARTGAELYSFGYDSRGYLGTITDAAGNSTAVERDAAGRPTAIISSGGHRTVLSTDVNGFLSTVADPAGNAWSFAYTADGLLTRAIDPNGHASEYVYDFEGLLRETRDAAGGGMTLAREEIPSGRKVATESAEGVRTEYSTQWFSNSIYQANIGCCGTLWSDIRDTGITINGTGDGSNSRVIMGTDPRFGGQVPFMEDLLVETPGGRSIRVGRNVDVYQDNALDPFSMTQYDESLYFLDPISGIARSVVYRKNYLAETRQEVLTTPTGRTRTTIYDESGRVVQKQRGGLAAVDLVYNAQGRIESIMSGEGAERRSYGFDYSADGRPARIIDPLGRIISFSRNAAGWVTGTSLPADARWALAMMRRET
jgi:YD repeat-containing protein